MREETKTSGVGDEDVCKRNGRGSSRDFDSHLSLDRCAHSHPCLRLQLALWGQWRHAIHISIFVFAGGSVSNMYAMNLARYKYCPGIKEKGLSGLPRLILFTSAEVKLKLFLMWDTDCLKMNMSWKRACLFGGSQECFLSVSKSCAVYSVVFHSRRNSDAFDIVSPDHPLLYITFT